SLWRSFNSLKDVGVVQVKVIRAEGLMAADVTGKSDPFCVVELSNDRLQTHTVYKNLNPEWNKVFTFNVKDIHSVLEVTVYDEDRDRSADFLGKVAIPLLNIQNGERKAYALKSKELTGPTKGVIFLEIDVIFNAVKAGLRTLIPIEQKYIEEEPRVSKQLLLHNFNRVRRCIMFLINTGCFINSCFEWDSPQRSICAFVLFVIVVWNFELYMIPLALLLPLVWNYILIASGKDTRQDMKVTPPLFPNKTATLERKDEGDGVGAGDRKRQRYSERWSDRETEEEGNGGGWQALLSAESDMAVGDSMHHGIWGLQSYTSSSFIGCGPLKHQAVEDLLEDEDEDFDKDDKDPKPGPWEDSSDKNHILEDILASWHFEWIRAMVDSERKGFMNKLYAIQDVCISVQNALDEVASYGERIKNTFNWTVPFLSWLAIVAFGAATILIYYIPLRYIVLAWGVNKFTKKLRDPYTIDNNELLDFLSRVPSDVQVVGELSFFISVSSFISF
ncbi:Multiple C2 and transmembrane domain containing protein 1, partial [Dissostichus eleginoides]